MVDLEERQILLVVTKKREQGCLQSLITFPFLPFALYIVISFRLFLLLLLLLLAAYDLS